MCIRIHCLNNAHCFCIRCVRMKRYVLRIIHKRRSFCRKALIAGSLGLTFAIVFIWLRNDSISQALDQGTAGKAIPLASSAGKTPTSYYAGNVISSVNCRSNPQTNYPFCNPELSAEERAEDLVSRLSLVEMINQTSTIAPAIPRLGINAYNWRSNCMHGWSKSGGPDWLGYTWTVFPAPINLAATFDKALVLQAGQVTSTEGRALHNEVMAHYNGLSQEASGLNCFSPNVNLLRDPRWGRAEETFGEDPYLISQLGHAYTVGLQEGSDSRYLKVAACPKHYAAHSGPDQLRDRFTANITIHDLYDTYLPAFKSVVVASKAAQIMPSYTGVRFLYQKDGAPGAANPYLLRTILREQFGAPNISIVSDNGGVEEVFSTHHFAGSREEAAALCMNSTTDLDLGFDIMYPKHLPAAIERKIVRVATIKAAVWRNFYLRIKVGDFDPVSMVPYQRINASQLNTPESQALNLKATLESIVLLKNAGHLPLTLGTVRKLAVIGPLADATQTLLSNFEGIPAHTVSVLEGIQTEVAGSIITVEYASGCINATCANKTKFDSVLGAVKDADFVIAVMGLDEQVEGEMHDRANTTCESQPVDNLALPGCQGALLEAVIAVNPRVILVLINGGPVSIPNLYTNKGVVGIVEAFYPGPLGGRAVADVLFGKYNPGGKMPYTVFKSSKEIPNTFDYDMTTPPGRTYRYYTGKPLIPFGYGLSYAKFDYVRLTILRVIKPCDSITVFTAVRNSGKMAGDEVIQLYVEPPRQPEKPFIPKTQLLGFNRVYIEPSETHSVEFELNPYLLSLVDEDGEHYLFPGLYTVVVTGGLEEEKLTGQFTMEGSATNVKNCPQAPQCLAC